MTPTIVVAAPATGSGKTLIAAGLARSFARAGLVVGAFKVGPDYIDVGYLDAATGGRAGNIDPWAMRVATQDLLLEAVADGADIVIGEGVMGLFDGARDGSGSTADLCARLRLPVLLAVDARRQGPSLAAIVHGFATYRAEVEVAGVVLNRVGGPSHADLLSSALIGPPLVGTVPEHEALTVPSRHLGLRQARENPELDRKLDGIADILAEHIDLRAVQALAKVPQIDLEAAPGTPIPPLGQRIAVADDEAFGFCYAHVIAGWHAAGAELSRFSPLADQTPDPTADAIYLPGGYPEVWAGQLADSRRFLASLGAAAKRGTTIYGECGGYIVMGQGLVDGAGKRHRMAGLLGLECSFATPRRRLGYRNVTLASDGPLGLAGRNFRGHEFHYATAIVAAAAKPLMHASDAIGRDLGPLGETRGHLAGSFVHLVDAAN
ncbi:MAG: cobyrinate a,c-diamide synthase [Alphaproteobacteria bacterium]